MLEIWAYGLRNPWRLHFDRLNGTLYVSDVGNNTWEEINKVEKGGNYGWPNAEGPCTNCPYINPFYSYDQTVGNAVAQPLVYRGNMFPAAYQGHLFYGDYQQGFIKQFAIDGNGNAGVADVFDPNAGSVVNMKEAPDGSIYYTTYYPGALYRITYSTTNQIPVANASAGVTKGTNPLTVNFSSSGSYDPDGTALTYNWDFGDGTFSTQPNPTKTYDKVGTYNAFLTVSDGSNSSQSRPVVIQVGIPPKVTIATPANLSTNLTTGARVAQWTNTQTFTPGQTYF